MNTEQIRADFEVFAIPRNYDLDAVMLLSKPPKFSHYVNQATQDAFEAYQAGRAALQESLDKSQDREDAERYRCLREGQIDDIAVVRGLGATDYGASVVIGTYEEEIDGDDLDEAIDHARRIEEKTE